MNRLYSRAGAFALSSALCLITVGRLSAQTTAAPAAANPNSDETIVLSPFVVEASEDQGYTAKDTLAGTRVRTELKDVASAISVVTAQFLKDTGAKNSADLLVYTPSTEVGGIRGNFSGVAGTGIYQENTISSTTRVRGLDSADNTRDYFLTDIPWDGFNVGRVDLQRGPNSILFGIGSPAGIINTSVNDAAFKTAYNYENRVDQYGSLRNSVSFNQELVKGVLAIRVAALKDDELFEQKPAFNNTDRFYGALRFDPKLFGDDNHTSIRAKYEQGKVTSNNPRSIPPGDNQSLWFKTGVDAQGNPGYNKIIINQFNPAMVLPYGTFGGLKGGTLTNGLQLANQGRSFWPDIINYYEATPLALNNVLNAPVPGGTPISTGAGTAIAAQASINKGIKDNGGGTLAGLQNAFLPLAIPQMSSYAQGLGNTGGFPGGARPGGVYYANVVLQDPSVFNFYKKLLDGPNKHEWQKWHALNVAFDQSLFHDRLNMEVAFDHQDFLSGANQWMAGENYALNIDINATFADGSPNPNVGRPYAGNGASAPGLNFQDSTVRNTFRFTPTYELRTEDFLGKTALSKILGRHIFTAVYENATVKKDHIETAEFATTAQYILDNAANIPGTTPKTGQLEQDRSFEWIAYLGPSLANKSSAKGANLQNINFVVAPPANQTATHFDATWKASSASWNALPSSFVKNTGGDYNAGTVANPTIVHNGDYANGTNVIPKGAIFSLPDGSVGATYRPATAAVAATGTTPAVAATPATPYYVNPTQAPAGYVDPGAPFTYVRNTDNTVQNVHQLDNPANYVGWTQQNINWMRSSNPADYPSLVAGANRTRYRDISTGFTWQGKLLDGDFVPTFGWRKDVITNYQTNSVTDPISGFTTLDYPDDLGSRTDVRGESKSWGGVYHLPKSITSKLPWGSGISIFYDRSSNFKADASRLSMAGTPIPNATGQTKEYGFTITTLNDKLSLKIDWFKTKVANATLADTQGNSIGGLGSNGYFIADGSIWGYGWATSLQDGLAGRTTDNYYDYAAGDGLPKGTAAEIAAYNTYNHTGGTFTRPDGTVRSSIGGDNIVNAWLKAPFPSTFFSSYHLTPAIDPTIGSRTGNLRDSYAGGPNNTNGPNLGGGSSFGNHQTTVDNLSRGTEVELSYQPVKNWNLTLNYSRIHATHENIDPVSQAFIGTMTKFMNGPGGQIREWGNGNVNNTLGSQWNSSIVAPYTVELNELGHAAPEVSPWRFNLVTSYTFDRGVIKGLFVGGAARIEAGRIIGYQFDPNFKNANSSDPNYANVQFLTLGGLNVDKPFIGENERHYDAWVGYSRKLTNKITWRVQLNVRSVGESDRLVASRINPDGSIALARIVQGAGYQLTNSFDF